MVAQPVGYSGTPLAKKFGIKRGFSVMIINAPSHYFNLFTGLPDGITINDNPDLKKDFIHFFTTQKDAYIATLPDLKDQVKPNGMIWVSWPKKASKIETNISEQLIRNFAMETGLVDIKVCAVDEIWSGLKLVIPVKDRSREGLSSR